MTYVPNVPAKIVLKGKKAHLRRKRNRFDPKMKKIKTSDIVKCAVGAAMICVTAPLAIYTGTIPVSLSLFAICLAAGVLGKYRGTVAVFVYVLLGSVGMPVFSFFTGGFQRILSPTGGYIMGYLPGAFIAGVIIDIAKDKFFIYPVGMICGTVICYITGTLWYCFYAKCGVVTALSVCVVPFVLFDVVKIAAASIVAYNTRKVTDRL